MDYFDEFEFGCCAATWNPAHCSAVVGENTNNGINVPEGAPSFICFILHHVGEDTGSTLIGYYRG